MPRNLCLYHDRRYSLLANIYLFTMPTVHTQCSKHLQSTFYNFKLPRVEHSCNMQVKELHHWQPNKNWPKKENRCKRSGIYNGERALELETCAQLSFWAASSALRSVFTCTLVSQAAAQRVRVLHLEVLSKGFLQHLVYMANQLDQAAKYICDAWTEDKCLFTSALWLWEECSSSIVSL